MNVMNIAIVDGVLWTVPNNQEKDFDELETRRRRVTISDLSIIKIG